MPADIRQMRFSMLYLRLCISIGKLAFIIVLKPGTEKAAGSGA